MLSKPCRKCGKPGKALCDDCRKKLENQRGRNNSRARGYDSKYEAARKRMVERAWTRHENCVICGLSFYRRSDITAEHLVPKREGGTNDYTNLGPAHFSCNSSHRPPNAAFMG